MSSEEISFPVTWQGFAVLPTVYRPRYFICPFDAGPYWSQSHRQPLPRVPLGWLYHQDYQARSYHLSSSCAHPVEASQVHSVQQDLQAPTRSVKKHERTHPMLMEDGLKPSVAMSGMTYHPMNGYYPPQYTTKSSPFNGSVLPPSPESGQSDGDGRVPSGTVPWLFYSHYAAALAGVTTTKKLPQKQYNNEAPA